MLGRKKQNLFSLQYIYMEKKNMKFNTIIKSIILEQGGRYEILLKTYTTPKKKGDKVKPARMSKEQLDKIVLADPTTLRDGDKIKKAGKYTQWLLKQFLTIEPNIEADYGTREFKQEKEEKIRLYFEDLYKTTEDLMKFDRFKGQLEDEMRDINNLTLRSLEDAVSGFRLEKTKATKDEKKEASKTYEHPGGEVIHRGNDWTVVKIEDQGELGKDAACFYGGNSLRSGQGETSWCTSAPGLSYFNTYIKQGPLYVVIPNDSKSFKIDSVQKGEKSGLPALRYQFHFPSNQFMDPDDRQINLIEFLNDNEELKGVFKPEFMKGLTSSDGTEVTVEYPRDSASKFIALYGFDEFFDTLPDNLGRLDFIKSSGGYGYRNSDIPEDFTVNIPDKIGDYKDMYALHLDGIVKDLPKGISNLENLMFLSLPNNKQLKSLPKELAKKNGNEYAMKNLAVITLANGNPNIKIPEEVQQMIDEKGIKVFK